MKKLFFIVLIFLFTSNISSAKNIKEAYFAGGCFWCMEEFFEKVKGVEEVISGYTGGDTKNPTYKEVTYGNTGHFEAAKIIYDEDIINYKKLLNLSDFCLHRTQQIYNYILCHKIDQPNQMDQYFANKNLIILYNL